MTTTSAKSDDPGFWIILSFAIACGVTVANLYYAQPLIGPISEAFHLDISVSGLIVTMIQLGYVIGLIFLAPLGDLVENKTLILTALCAVIASLAISSFAPTASVFIAASLLLGITATATQMVLPVAAHLAPDHKRGQIVGTVMSGLLFGILLARPVSTLVAGVIGWRGVYAASAVAMLAVLVMLAFTLPRRQPDHTLNYGKLLGSMWSLLRTTPASTFQIVVPFLVLGAAGVLAFQDRLRSVVGHPASMSRRRRNVFLHAMVGLGAVYGGYFGAALGVMLVAGLGLVLEESLACVNALKNAVSAVCGWVTVVAFATFGQVDWAAVAVLAPATLAGGYLGARLARRLPTPVLRAIIVSFGLVVGCYLLVKALI